jgi:zinc transport system substrate-binding protein
VKSRIVLLCVIIAVLLSAGCGGDDAPEDGAVVAAFYPLAFAAQQVAGDDTAVENLTPPGAEPHDLELTARDVGRIRDAAVVVYVGEGFQPAIESALEGRGGPSLDVLHGIDLRHGSEGDRDAVDPHVWLDPLRFAAVARSIASALGDPAVAAPLVVRLEALGREYRRGLAQCRRREIVTSHAAFGYLADRYGLEQVPLVGISPEAEPGPREIERLVRKVRETGATTVFFETLVPPDLAETVARESGATTAVLDPLEGLTSAELEAGADYFTVMRENLAALRKALACT